MKDERFLKLPKWTQDYISKIERERDVAIIALRKAEDHSKESPFFYEDLACTGERKGPSNLRFYIQAHHIVAEYAGIRVELYCVPNENHMRFNFGDIDRSLEYAVMTPVSYQQYEIRNLNNAKHWR